MELSPSLDRDVERLRDSVLNIHYAEVEEQAHNVRESMSEDSEAVTNKPLDQMADVLLTSDVLKRLMIPESALRTWIRNRSLRPGRLSNGEYVWDAEQFEKATTLADKWKIKQARKKALG
jgi:hypothetical protein